MLLNLMSFLLVFFQSFHIGGTEITVHTCKQALSVISCDGQFVHKSHSSKAFTTIIGIEETEDTDNISVQSIGQSLSASASDVFINIPVDIIKLNQSGISPSLQYGKHLFLLHHNLRV